MNRHIRIVAAFNVAGAVFAVTTACSPSPSSAPTGAVRPGGELVASTRTEPRTFNRYAGRTQTDALLATLLHAPLVRINHATEEVEPWLAESWTRSDDGLRYTLKLRPNVAFSDGHPFTADDVLFSFAAVYDDKLMAAGGPLGDVMQVDHKKLQVAAPDPQTVVLTFPAAFAPALRILDQLPILPRHKLEQALKDGTLAAAWGVSTPPADIVGLGPFKLGEYIRGQRVVVTRNPYFWRKDAGGTALPYLDRLTLEVVTDQDAEQLRLESGQVDMALQEIRPVDYAPLKRAADAGRVKLLDLGVATDADCFWINLKPGGLGKDPRAAWLQKDELRHAISMAVDRQAFADTVYLGAGVPVFGPETPGNKKWYSPDAPRSPHDPARAKELLAAIGLTDRNGDGSLEDARNQPAQFSLLTLKGSTSMERGAAVIRDELKKIGVTVNVVPLEQPAVVSRFLSGNYDAVYFRVGRTDTDPAISPDFWLSSGGGRVWNIGQKTPATDWERRIDELVRKQMASSDEAERKRLHAEVQKVFAEHLPTIYFVAPRVYVAHSSRVLNVTPSVIRPQLLWAADTIAVVH